VSEQAVAKAPAPSRVGATILTGTGQGFALPGSAQFWLILPALLVALVVFALPVGWLLAQSVLEPEFGLQNFQQIWEVPLYFRLISNTLEVSAITTLLCVLLAYPVAHAMVAYPRYTKLLIFIVLIPFWSSVLVRTFAWMVILQNNGLIAQFLRWTGLVETAPELIFNRTGVLIGMVQVLLPFTIFPLYGALKSLDPRLMQAASCLGAPPLRAFWRVQLPLILPGIATGAILVFVMALGFFVTPALLGGRRDLMIAKMIQLEIEQNASWGMAAALSLILLVLTLVLMVLAQTFSRRKG